MGVWDEGSGTKSVSFKGDPVIEYRNLLVLEVQEDQPARDFKTGETKYWKYKAGPNKGQPNYDDPILTSPVVVYSKDFNDPSIPNDNHVRVLWCEVAKNLTRAVFGAKKAAGRRGPLHPGDVIGRVAFTKQDPDTDLKHYDASGYQLGTGETIERADQLRKAHEIWLQKAATAPASSSTWADDAPANTGNTGGNAAESEAAELRRKLAELEGKQTVGAGTGSPFD
jgi:hypothetical protein